MDDIDRRILRLLQQDCGLTYQRIADAVGVSASSALRRIDRLRREKVIVRQVAVLDPRAAGVGATAFVHVKLSTHSNTQHKQALVADLAQHDCVVGLHTVAGDIDMIVQIKCADLEQLSNLAEHLLGGSATVQQYYTYISMARHKETTELPL